MEIARTASFKKAYKKLDPVAKIKIKKCIEQMAKDLSHPSLRTKKMKGYKNPFVWEATASQGSPALRMTYERISGGILLRNCGEHDTVYMSP
ncbi:hypothetical protein [Aureibacillus halotolerans]|uniref:mRNA-degrading endonuclease RelE of RelBE toxin-antitoxin system n=1 Tax=Aureibacillus halotolerans TaxID=1508390 RepID=A0A4R6TSZ9_9BACI|nr:hypothetical protein [Aureibacillus halotolerans]TDQ33447.1 hypothetical protein EV213_13121 [Aureibacillus halotolerans]